jgi:hypothetical protein
MSIVLLVPLDDSLYPAKTASYTGTAGSTGTWPAGPQGVLVWSDQACYVTVGESVTATTSSTPVPANTPIPFIVPQGTGGAWRVSALQVSTGGTVYAKPMNQ